MKKHTWLMALLLLVACQGTEPNGPNQNQQPVLPDATASYAGFYLLNDGPMGANKATLDYFDYKTGVYENNIFPARNPSVIDELGDAGTGLAIYGSKMYALLNGSGLVEVMDAKTATHITSIAIPNVRSMEFYQGKAYFSSYAGKVEMGGVQLGYVAEVDTATLTVGRTVTVGRQPEEMAIKDGKMYVANSGGYTPDNYDNTLSVIDLATFTEVKKIEVAINLHRLFLAPDGSLYVSSRGNYADVPANLYVVDTQTGKVVKTLNKGVMSVAIKDDVAYVLNIEYGPAPDYQTVYDYYTIHLATHTLGSGSFLSDEVKNSIVYPYSVAVHPVTGDILLTDASDFVTPGTLFYCNPKGELLWRHTTGDIPGSVAFLP